MNTLPAELTPTFLNHLKAKSQDRGGQTLAEHTWDVVARLADLYRLRPQLGDQRFWRRQYYACFLHDYGKAARGFQERLLDKPLENEWFRTKHRHEVLSLAFVDWLFLPGHADGIATIAIIATHHKDVDVIWGKYGPPGRSSDQRQRVEYLISQIDKNDLECLRRWLSEYAEQWRAALGFPAWDALTISQSATISAQSIYAALDDLSDYHLCYEDVPPDRSNFVTDLLVRGLILTADHAASGGAGEFPPMPLTWEIVQRPLTGKTARTHQRTAGDASAGSTILIAPTGSGKTEAALLWAMRQIDQRPAARLFYTLPYQASMNAMYARLAQRYFGLTTQQMPDPTQNQVVAIQHSRALLKLYQDAMGLDEMDERKARLAAERLRNLAQLNRYPIQIFSPYQMLKAAYSLKGYETLLLDYTGALFIFDEIHAYEPKRLAMIITLIAWLRQQFGARFFVMTATLPPPVQERLISALAIDEQQIILADTQEFQRSQRHNVYRLPGQLRQSIVERVRTDLAAGRSVLICLNRVADAQRIYKLLKNAGLGLVYKKNLLLLHSRFNGKDRQDKEELLLQRVGVGRVRGEPIVVVATQVVEVSLDVDFDVLYSDPAPLEALLQRFGRVNRGRTEQTLCPVYVFELPDSDHPKSPYKPYDEKLVRRALEVLASDCSQEVPIDESKVTEMLGKIYQDEIRTEWEAEYASAQQDFQRAILDAIVPFKSAPPERLAAFYKLFDGVEILPTNQLETYDDAREAKRFLDARRLLVNINYAQYCEFLGYGLIVKASEMDGSFADHIEVEYDEEYGLQLDEARQARKLARLVMKNDHP